MTTIFPGCHYRTALAELQGQRQDGKRWIELVSVGARFPRPVHDDRGKMEIVEDVLDQIISNFSEPVPIKVSGHADLHGPVDPALAEAWAWIHEVRKETTRGRVRLFGLTEFPARTVEAIDKNKAFKWLSVEILPGRQQDADKDTPTGAYLRGATFTNHPVWDIPALVAGDMPIALSEELASSYHTGSHAGDPNSGISTNPERSEIKRPARKEQPMPDKIDTKALAESLGCTEADLATEIAALKAKAEAKPEAKPAENSAELATLAEQVRNQDATIATLAADLKAANTRAADVQFSALLADLKATGRIEDDPELDKKLRGYFDHDQANGTSLLADAYGSRPAGYAVPVSPIGHGGQDKSALRGDDSALAEKIIKRAEADKTNFTAATLAECAENPDTMAQLFPVDPSIMNGGN